MKAEIRIVTHPNWTKLHLRINDKEFISQILEELQERYPYFSSDYIEKFLCRFLIENEELSGYVVRPVIDISFDCDKTEINTLVNKIQNSFKRMLRYLDEKHQLVTQILENEGEI